MSDTGLYLNWKPSHADDDDEEADEADDDDDDELDPEMQENEFWESIADQAPTFAGKTLSIALRLCYAGLICGLVLPNGDYIVITNQRTFFSRSLLRGTWF